MEINSWGDHEIDPTSGPEESQTIDPGPSTRSHTPQTKLKEDTTLQVGGVEHQINPEQPEQQLEEDNTPQVGDTELEPQIGPQPPQPQPEEDNIPQVSDAEHQIDPEPPQPPHDFQPHDGQPRYDGPPPLPTSLDPKGDLCLKVGRYPMKPFMVCSRTLARSAPF
ncbi:hypothetical protein SAMD00023353_13100020 [Rosellinia necatrix]|uniref:Uncharacterized protein n=1 Tax=Rosellinia necatrix TaxID=77044 RepID=A0A1S8ABB4_ROSNE|nr:hypothetical protein SAMD00023353_13100020 [Rosellinia necatrix]